MFIARSSVSATTIATAIRLPIPKKSFILPIFGSAIIMSAANAPPIRIKGRLLPPQNQTLSLINPTITCPKIPASGPAAHTIPISCISNPYCEFNIQLSTAICIERAKPIAVAGNAKIE